MKRIETEVVIQRPIDQVFDYMIEPENLPDWAPGFLKATLTSKGPIQIASKILANRTKLAHEFCNLIDQSG